MRSSVVPSGRLNVKVTVSPSFGLAPRLTLIVGGTPPGPATAAPVSVEAMPASLKPNTVGGTSSFIETLVPAGAGITSRPNPLAPMSA